MTDLVKLDPSSDAAIAELLELNNAAAAVDHPWDPPPLLHDLVGGIRNPWHGEPTERWLLRDPDGRLIGRLVVRLPERLNRHLAGISVLIHPGHRRAGHGRRLYDHGRAVAVDAGRRLLTAHALDATAPNGFAERLGFSRTGVDVQRRQDLAEVDRERVAALRREAASAAGDYELLRIVGPVPDELVDAYAVMFSAINDAPTGDVEVEHDVIDRERIRVYERAQTVQGKTTYQLVARHRADGVLAGHTVVAVDAKRPEWSGQHNTSVLAAHRGHRLGLLLKAAMVEWILAELPDVRYLDTTNAETNHHMIRINDQLGYRIVARHAGWKQELAG